jgi:cytochrome b561
MTMALHDGSATATHYRPAARFLHWLVAGLIAVLIGTIILLGILANFTLGAAVIRVRSAKPRNFTAELACLADHIA